MPWAPGWTSWLMCCSRQFVQCGSGRKRGWIPCSRLLRKSWHNTIYSTEPGDQDDAPFTWPLWELTPVFCCTVALGAHNIAPNCQEPKDKQAGPDWTPLELSIRTWIISLKRWILRAARVALLTSRAGTMVISLIPWMAAWVAGSGWCGLSGESSEHCTGQTKIITNKFVMLDELLLLYSFMAFY